MQDNDSTDAVVVCTRVADGPAHVPSDEISCDYEGCDEMLWLSPGTAAHVAARFGGEGWDSVSFHCMTHHDEQYLINNVTLDNVAAAAREFVEHLDRIAHIPNTDNQGEES